MQKLISWDDLPEAARYSKQHIRILEKQGKFPKRVRLSTFRHAWIESEISQWVADRIAARDGVTEAA